MEHLRLQLIIRRVIKNKRSFLSEDAALKVIYLALNNCQKRMENAYKELGKRLKSTSNNV